MGIVIKRPSPTTKICIKCLIEKPLCDFYLRKAIISTGDAVYPKSQCKKCDNIRFVEWRRKNRHICRETDKRSYYKNHEKRIKKAREWKEKNKRRYLDGLNAQRKIRYKSDPIFRIKILVRSRNGRMIRESMGTKRFTDNALLGATWNFVRLEIERQWQHGMSWENHAKEWELDHHIPCAAWDLRNEHHQRACFNWRNLRPLTIIQNRQKRDFLPEGWQDYMAMLLEATRQPLVSA